MTMQALVVGLGQFGMSVARALATENVDVVAVDLREDRVQAASMFVAEAIRLDATDEVALRRVAPARRDLVMVAIGDEQRDSSIMVTALLRQLGVNRILARATDALHERILMLVGAHEVVNPDREFGHWLATRLAHPGVVDLLPLGEELALTEVPVPPPFVGRTLAELNLRKRHQVTVVAIRRVENGRNHARLPDPETPLDGSDTLILIGFPGASDALVEGF